MKTKITYLAALVCALILAPSVLADTEEGFYEKNHIRGFISIGGDYRGMFDEFRNYVNQVAFSNGYHVIGAQYKQFLTWFDINFMPTQISERPHSTYTTTSESGTSIKFPLYDVRWFCYGADWMFGWKLLGEDMPVNLIPAVGFGFNLINFHFASNFDLENEDGSYTALRDRYYSTIASTFNAELEIRLELGQFAIGAYGGYRAVRYNELNVEGERLETALGKYDTDNIGDTWFIGLRLTWIFLSDWQEKQNDKL